jgi:TonB-linked SusC/RagA family outer membrane protein
MKNKRLQWPGRMPARVVKFLLVMKLSALLMLTCCLQVSADVYSQKRFTLRFEQAGIDKIFARIQKESEYKFFYNYGYIRQLGKIDLQVSDATLPEILDRVLNNKLDYRILDRNRVVISPPEEINTQQDVKGRVTDSTGAPLPGVTVRVKGQTTGVITNANGEFSIIVPDGSVLEISSVGFEPREVTVSGNSFLNIQLKESASGLSEVVVVGYGAQQKKDLTSAISVVKADDIRKRQATTVAEALQGLASGINVRGGGQPGSEAKIEIRGTKNFTGSNPLYVIDGMITTANRDFNPNDIESIQILKDASAAAIYGSRAANGVIIITTKKGKEGPMKVEVSAKTSVQTIPRYELAETDEFSRLNFMAYDNAGATRQQLDLAVNTDWQDEAFRTGNMHDLNASFSGGGKSGTYMISANYFSNKGTVISTDFDRFSLRVNSQGSKGIFSIGENIAISNAKSDEMSGNPIIDVVRLLPTIPVYDASHPGGYGYGDEVKARTFGTNPVAIANLEDRTNENFRVRGNLWGEIRILPELKYRLNLGYETSADHYTYLRKQGNWTLNQAFDPAIANENRARWQSMLVENTLTFTKSFNKHSLTVLAGQTYQKDDYGQIWGTKRNILQNSGTGQYYPVLDQGNEPQTGGFLRKGILLSYLGRIEYNYADKYLLNALIRRDGSSRFRKTNQWGNFPGLSAAWRISQENFFDVNWINDLKLRASYGTVGNSATSATGYWDYLAVINTLITTTMGRDQHVEPGATLVKLVNADLSWEKLKQTNIGLDAAFLNNRLSVTAEYFINQTDDVLTAMPIALTTGNDGGNPVANAASLKNTGFELSAGYGDTHGELSYNVGLNFTRLRNKVLNLGYGRSNIYVGNTVTKIGQPIGMWYVLQTDGLFQSQEEVDNYKNKDGRVIQPNAKPGDIRFRDNDGNGQITNSDKVVVGDPWPDFEVGLNMGASWRGFEFSMNWFGSFGAQVFNGPRSVTDRFDDNSNYRKGIQPWTPENPNTDVPRAYYGTTLNSRGDIDRWLEPGSFARMKLVSLAWNVPTSLVKKIGFEHAQVSVSGQNLITITKYTGLDPEFNNASIFERGFDFGTFPNLKTYSVGLQFGF